MNPKTAAKWVEAYDYCQRNRSVPSLLAQVAARKHKTALRTLMDKKPAAAIRRPKGAPKVKTTQAAKKDLRAELEALCKAIVFTRDCGSPEAREGNCISCGQFRVLQWGHFIRQQDSKWLQYDPRNTGGQCRVCNVGGGNVLGYMKAIDKRDGAGAALALQREAELHDSYWRVNKTTLSEKLDKLRRHPLAPAPKDSRSEARPKGGTEST